jgi:outer membrane protein OmpA-like peptidoglycan-associated protein
MLRTLTAVVLLSSAAACSADEPNREARPEPSPTSPSASSPVTAAELPPEVSGPECAGREGREVTQLPDVVVPEVVVPPVTDADGEEVLAGFTVPAQLVDAGCVIRYDAPGGCLGAVEVTGATIPAATIPESRLRDQAFPAVTADATSRPGARAERVCQVEVDGRLATVSRAGVVREGFSRDGVARPGGTVDGVVVPTVRLDPVRLPDVDVDPGRLERRDLPGAREVGVLTGEGRTAYVAPSRVLFDTDQATLRPDAQAALDAIARRIRQDAPRARLLVEGHTDDRGDETYGLRLSERRAAAVATWLARTGGFERARIRTRGLGETAPAVPNTSAANRQKNRRVVITVLG